MPTSYIIGPSRNKNCTVLIVCYLVGENGTILLPPDLGWTLNQKECKKFYETTAAHLLAGDIFPITCSIADLNYHHIIFVRLGMDNMQQSVYDCLQCASTISNAQVFLPLFYLGSKEPIDNCIAQKTIEGTAQFELKTHSPMNTFIGLSEKFIQAALFMQENDIPFMGKWVPERREFLI